MSNERCRDRCCAPVLLRVSASVGPRRRARTTRRKTKRRRRKSQSIVKIVDDLAAGAAGAERSRAGVGARGRPEGAGQQGIRAVHGQHRSVEGRPAATVAFYWRVVSKGAALPPAAADAAKKDDKKDDKDKDKDKKSEYAYEDISFMPVTAGQTPMRSRARSPCRPATTTSIVVVKEPTPEKAPKNAPPPKMSALKQTVRCRISGTTSSETSSVIVAQRIDPLPAPLTPQQQAERPYALGTMEIVPASTPSSPRRPSSRPSC